MNNEQLTVTIPFGYYERLKKYEAAIIMLKKDQPYLVITKIESKCGFIENYNFVNIEDAKDNFLKAYNYLLKENTRLLSENIKLTSFKPTIWQLLKEKIGL